MMYVGMSLSLLSVILRYTEDQSLLEVNLSAILDLFGSNQFMSCPQVLSFF